MGGGVQNTFCLMVSIMLLIPFHLILSHLIFLDPPPYPIWLSLFCAAVQACVAASIDAGDLPQFDDTLNQMDYQYAGDSLTYAPIILGVEEGGTE
jgi:hypothetical protein